MSWCYIYILVQKNKSKAVWFADMEHNVYVEGKRVEKKQKHSTLARNDSQHLHNMQTLIYQRY